MLGMRSRWRTSFITVILVWVVIDMAIPEGFAATAFSNESVGHRPLLHHECSPGPQSSDSEADCFCGIHVMPAKVAPLSRTGVILLLRDVPDVPSFESFVPRLEHPPRT